MGEQTSKQQRQEKRIMELYGLLHGQDREALDQAVVTLLGEVDQDASRSWR